jgi:putative nucleotidyltransferase with HDIG domain
LGCSQRTNIILDKIVEPFSLPPLVERIIAELPADVPMALVGGAVRDLLLNRPIHDYDFILPEDAVRIARRLADKTGAAYMTLDAERDIARLIWKDGQRVSLDFAAYQGPDLLADLWARDFTINAIAIDLRNPGKLIDPTGGISDLLAKQIRPCLPDSFKNDPVRVLRAIRLANTLEARLPTETLALMRQAVAGLPSISPERLRDELFKILDLPQAATALRIMNMVGALGELLPDLVALQGLQQSPPHVQDAWEHTLDVINRLQSLLDVLSPAYDAEGVGSLVLGLAVLRLGRYRGQLAEHFAEQLNPERSLRSLLNFAALYHDVGKSLTRSVDADGRIRFFEHEQVGADVASARGHALRLSNAEIERLRTIVRHHMRPSLLAQAGGIPSRKAVYHFFRDTGEAGVDVCLLSLADTLATYGPTLPQERWAWKLDLVRHLLESCWEHSQEVVSPPALVNGHDLIETLDISPGPRLGEILEAIREAQAEGHITSREEALEWALKYYRR